MSVLVLPEGLAVFLVALFLSPQPAAAGTQDRECIFAKQQQWVEPNIRATNDLQENATIRCNHASYCYGLWEINKDQEVHLVQQGCWPHNGSQQHCHDDRCLVTNSPSQMARREYRFCCCNKDLCNLNFSHDPLGRTAAAPTPGLHPLPQEETLVIAVVTVTLALLLIGALLLGYRMFKGNYKQTVVNPGALEAANPEPVDLEDLKLLECIGRGRYGSVFRAVLNQRTVAVKAFSGHHHFITERSVYLLPLLRQHNNIAAFLGAEERTTSEGRSEYLLVMEYYPLGCLGVYLSSHSPDWLSCCRMLHSATTGLAFLHAELYRGELYKPAVCHRDINSRNILVRGDLSCVLSDFGLSMTLTRTGLPLQGDEEHSAISEAGTLRYMAPEVLEGAVNLKDCDSALKQVDVYALGLVYWETFRRCSDLYPSGETVPEYQMVFEEELGKQPSFQDMQRLVSRDKQRPSFPWKDSSHAVWSLRDTIEECWDQDAEARLTAQCAAQRLADFLAPNTRSPALYNHRNLAEGSRTAADSSYIEDQVGVVRNMTGDGYLAAVSAPTGGKVMEKNRNTINYQRQQAQVRLSPEGSDVTLISTISDSASSPVLKQLTQEDLEATKLDPKEVDKNLRGRRCEEVLMKHSEKLFSCDPLFSMTNSLLPSHPKVSRPRGGGGMRTEAPHSSPSALLPLPKQQNLPQRPLSLLLPPNPRQAGPCNTTLREVQTGVAKMDKVTVIVTTVPHQVTTVTRSILGGGGAGAQAVKQVANGHRGGVHTLVIGGGGGGRSNPAGPQEEEEEKGGGGTEKWMEGGGDSCQSILTLSPDEHAPLLHSRHHHPHSGTNDNNNNNNPQQPASCSLVTMDGSHKQLAPHSVPVAPPAQRMAPPCSHSTPPPPALHQACTGGGPFTEAEPDAAAAGLSLGSGLGYLPSERQAADRPSSLDLSSSSASSGDKIKRRVKTPYVLKKPRPATWVVNMETSLDSEIDHFSSSSHNSFPKIQQSKSSMAVFMVAGITSDPS